MVTTRTKLAVIEAAGSAVPGVRVEIDLKGDDAPDLVRAWCTERGLGLVEVEQQGSAGQRLRFVTGIIDDPVDALPDDRRPGARLWLYTNFNCNLACDYCCVSSSPRTPRRALSIEVVRRLAAEAPDAGVRAIYLTGGEPFLRADIAELVALCAAAVPTTILTNGMLFGGARRGWLEACPRENTALQISVDSAAPELHDRHRGAGSHRAALEGIRVALDLGFRVRVAATLGPDDLDQEAALHAMCAGLGVPEDDRVVRRIARQGEAEGGVTVSRRSLVPEICVTDEGVCWHPVAAADPAMRIVEGVPPLHEIIRTVTDEYSSYRQGESLLAASFPCA